MFFRQNLAYQTGGAGVSSPLPFDRLDRLSLIKKFRQMGLILVLENIKLFLDVVLEPLDTIMDFNIPVVRYLK